jgi:tRNA dimethylallyltransferase
VPRRIFLTGPTASGKGAVAHALALRLGGEVVAVDSMKVYREMDIGTAKPSSARRAEVPHHLVDFVDPARDFSVGEYLPMALRTIAEIEGRGRTAILCGGTALYLNALVHGLFRGPPADWTLRRALMEECDRVGAPGLHARLAARDPAAARKIHPNDRRRIVRALEVLDATGRPMTDLWREESLRLEPGTYELTGIGWDRAELYRRIDERVLRMVRDGLFDEAQRLRARPGGIGRAASQCIGYREIFQGEEGGVPVQETIALIQRETRRFAKQQMTWFRRFPIRWHEAVPGVRAEEIATRILAAAPADR